MKPCGRWACPGGRSGRGRGGAWLLGLSYFYGLLLCFFGSFYGLLVVFVGSYMIRDHFSWFPWIF